MPESGQNFQDFAEQGQDGRAEQQAVIHAAQKRAAGHEDPKLTVAEPHPQKKQRAADKQPEQGVSQVADAPGASLPAGPQKIVYQGDHGSGAEGNCRLV